MKRFEIEYGKPPKTNKWGYYAKKQPPIYNEFFNSLDEACKRAREVSKEHKNFDVNVYDTDCTFEGEEHTTMLVVGFDKGVAWYNENYKL